METIQSWGPGILITILGFSAVYFLGVPLLIWSTFRMSAEPDPVVIDPEETRLPRHVFNQFEDADEDLGDLGFEPLEILSLPQQMDNVMAILKVYEHRKRQDYAMAVTMFSLEADRWQTAKSYVEFDTKFENGISFSTSNSTEITAFLPRENSNPVYIHWIQDLADLYQIHCGILDTKAPRKPKASELDTLCGGDVAEFVAIGIVGELESARKDGYLQLDLDEENYTATGKGAYLMTWSQLPPMKWFVRKKFDRRARTVLRECGLDEFV